MSEQVHESVWHNPLLRHLAVILVVKVLLLTVLWWMFSPFAR